MNYYALDEALAYLEGNDVLDILENQVKSIIELSNDPIFDGYEILTEMDYKFSIKLKEFLKTIGEKIKALVTKAAYTVSQFADEKIYKKISSVSLSIKSLDLYDIHDKDFEADWDKFTEEYNKAIDDFNHNRSLYWDAESDEEIEDSYEGTNDAKNKIINKLTEFKKSVSKVAESKVNIDLTEAYRNDPKKLYTDYTYTINYPYKQMLTTFKKLTTLVSEIERLEVAGTKSFKRYNINRLVVEGSSALTSIGFNMLKMGMSNAHTILKVAKYK